MTRNLSSIKSLKMQGFSQPGGLSSPRKAEPACLLDGGVHNHQTPRLRVTSALVHTKEVREALVSRAGTLCRLAP